MDRVGCPEDVIQTLDRELYVPVTVGDVGEPVTLLVGRDTCNPHSLVLTLTILRLIICIGTTDQNVVFVVHRQVTNSKVPGFYLCFVYVSNFIL